MAYQNVGTPRFYVNVLEWLDSIGSISYLDNSFRTLPVTLTTITNENGYMYVYTDSPAGIFNNKSFFAVLGHVSTSNFDGGGQGTFFVPTWNGENLDWIGEPNEILINCEPSIGSWIPGYSGFSIGGFDGSYNGGLSGMGFRISYGIEYGSIILGTYYDMLNAPNLSLTMSREYGGTKEFTTYNGSSMSNTMWSKPPMWGDLGAWELHSSGTEPQSLTKSGRRTWDLKFSYMADSDLWGSNQMISYMSPNTDSQNIAIGYEIYDVYESSVDITSEESKGFNYNLLTDYNFFSQVWHKTLGGTLPFIFQPDSSNNNPDQFCIAKFKDNSLKATQSAHNVYDISVSIEEVW